MAIELRIDRADEWRIVTVQLTILCIGARRSPVRRSAAVDGRRRDRRRRAWNDGIVHTIDEDSDHIRWNPAIDPIVVVLRAEDVCQLQCVARGNELEAQDRCVEGWTRSHACEQSVTR